MKIAIRGLLGAAFACALHPAAGMPVQAGTGRSRRDQRQGRHGRRREAGSAGRRRARRSHRRRWAAVDAIQRYVGHEHPGHRRRRAARHPRSHREPRPLHWRRRGAARAEARRPRKTWDEIVAMVENAAKTAKPGQWIYGRGWHQEKWTAPPAPNVEGFPTEASLSKVSPNNPVLLTHASGHASFANALAMKLSGIIARRRRVPPAARF